jgi:oligopeptide/dipeptide ABC transporter ATP-binding protein
MVFQEPMTSLNPVLTAGRQIVEAVELHQGIYGKHAWRVAEESLGRVGIADPQRRVREYPHQMSGGMRQRVMIAMALACRPSLLIADEPTTALDVTTQAQILTLLRTLQAETGMSILLITHDLGVAAEMAHRIVVMYAGRIVEGGPARDVLGEPLHPYTCGLLECTPGLVPRDGRLPVIPGSVPDPSRFPRGCRFHPRCRLSERLAAPGQRPTLTVDRGDAQVSILASCHDGRPEDQHGTRGPELREIRKGHHAACWEV